MASMKVALSFVIALFGVSSVLQGCGGGSDDKKSDAIPGIAEGTADLSTLVAALKAADLVGTLSGEGPFTVFAPTNEAFKAIPVAELDYLLAPEQKADLVKLLTYHVVNGSIQSGELKNGEQVKTLEGGNLTIKITNSSNTTVVKVNNATVEKADVKASNGFVHIINEVLIPSGFSKLLKNIPGVATEKNFTTLVDLVKKAGLAETLSGSGPFTVFAPTDAAFAAVPKDLYNKLLANKTLLANVLLYHVLKDEEVTSKVLKDGPLKTAEGQNVTIKISGSDVSINNANVTKADVFAVNGVIHVIDAVLIPPNSTVAPVTPASPVHIVV